MSTTLFRSFVSTVNPFRPGGILANLRLLVDSTTGAPVGIQNPNANGADGIWVPIDITAAQVASPTPGMIADINATYRLNAAPYSRYVSNGQRLVAVGGTQDVVPATGLFSRIIAYSPFTVDQPDGVTVYGELRVESFPA